MSREPVSSKQLSLTRRTGSHESKSVNRSFGALEKSMKVAASVKKMCRNCKVIRRNGVVRVICTDPRHKQRQG